MRPYKLPLSKGPVGPLVGPRIESFTVGSWCNSPDGSGTPVAVAISARMKIDDFPMDVVIRLKSPMEVDRTIQMLLRHKREVWPDEG